jgi:hypothetical protein
MRTVVAVGSAFLLAACSSHGSSDAATTADISKIGQVKSDFGPEFKVKDVAKTSIDPKVLSTHKLPPGLTFDPPSCSSVAIGPEMPAGLNGNMAAVSAEGDGNRFIAIALQTSEAVPYSDPGRNCKKVAFEGEGGRLRGLIEAVDSPQIDGTHTLGVHRVLQTTTNGQVRSGELYNFAAYFGDYQVIVTANPVLQPGKAPAPIDVNKARDLLVKSVAAVRS